MQVALQAWAVQVEGKVADIGGASDINEVAVRGDFRFQRLPTLAGGFAEGVIQPSLIHAARESANEHAGA